MKTFDDALARWPWLMVLAGCPQDPEYHAEGNVLTHTRMAVDALQELPAWRVVTAFDRDLLWTATVLHDVGKPRTTWKEPDGRITSKGHSLRGAAIARRYLYLEGMGFKAREEVVNLIRWHQFPFHAVDDLEGPWKARLIAEGCRHALLGCLAEADALGRVSALLQDAQDQVGLYKVLAEEAGVADGPYPFASEAARVDYFEARGGRPPDLFRPDPVGSRVTVMSGLPGSGKTRWLKEHAPELPVVSLDALRVTMDVDPTDEQGGVVQAAREAAREHLRLKRDFAWDATSLTSKTRRSVIRLAMDYGARVRMVYVEAPHTTLRQQNANRDRVVPWGAIEHMLDRWEPPTRDEAHEVLYVTPGA